MGSSECAPPPAPYDGVERIVSEIDPGAGAAAREVADQMRLKWSGFRSSRPDATRVEPVPARAGAQPGRGAAEANVRRAHAVVAFAPHTDVTVSRTVGFALTGRWQRSPFKHGRFSPDSFVELAPEVGAGRPVFAVLDLDDWPTTAVAMAAFLRVHRVGTLYVCGPVPARNADQVGADIADLLLHAVAAARGSAASQ